MEKIRFFCPACGKGYSAPSTSVGKTVSCKGCQKEFQIPPATQTTATNAFEVACPNCKKRFNVQMDDGESVGLGTTVSCDYCGVTKRVASFQKELKRQIEAPQKEADAKLKEEKKQEDKELKAQIAQAKATEAQARATEAQAKAEAQANAVQPAVAAQAIVMGSQKSPGVAAILSFFWVGLGQIYNGELGKGLILMLFIWPACLLSCFIFIGFILCPVVWIWGMFDAYSVANKANVIVMPMQQPINVTVTQTVSQGEKV